MLSYFETLAAKLRRKPKLSRAMAAVLAPYTAAAVYDEARADALARRSYVNAWPSGSELGGAYERGFLAGVAARGFNPSG